MNNSSHINASEPVRDTVEHAEIPRYTGFADLAQDVEAGPGGGRGQVRSDLQQYLVLPQNALETPIYKKTSHTNAPEQPKRTQ